MDDDGGVATETLVSVCLLACVAAGAFASLGTHFETSIAGSSSPRDALAVPVSRQAGTWGALAELADAWPVGQPIRAAEVFSSTTERTLIHRLTGTVFRLDPVNLADVGRGLLTHWVVTDNDGFLRYAPPVPSLREGTGAVRLVYGEELGRVRFELLGERPSRDIWFRNRSAGLVDRNITEEAFASVHNRGIDPRVISRDIAKRSEWQLVAPDTSKEMWARALGEWAVAEAGAHRKELLTALADRRFAITWTWSDVGASTMIDVDPRKTRISIELARYATEADLGIRERGIRFRLPSWRFNESHLWAAHLRPWQF